MARARTPSTRRILCTHCDGPLEVDEGAKSVSCSHCHQRVVCEALTVKDYVAVRTFRTANRMHVTRKGIVYAAVRADELVVDGVLQGEAASLGLLHLARTAKVTGRLRAARLRVDEGATLSCEVVVGPDAVPGAVPDRVPDAER
jgi:LSD1 subclass zinc finger protein